jgi:hypothetical protein
MVPVILLMDSYRFLMYSEPEPEPEPEPDVAKIFVSLIPFFYYRMC